MKYKIVEKWTTSKGAGTYGQNICSLWHQNKKIASHKGLGFNMLGVCFADVINNWWLDNIQSLDTKEFKNLTKSFSTIFVSDFANFNEILRILEAINICVESHKVSDKLTIHLLEDKNDRY